MESDKLIDKLIKWVLLLHYDFEVVHLVGITNLDTYGFSRNPSPSDKDLTGARWHGDCNREAVPSWYIVAYLTLFYGVVVEVSIHGFDDETNQP